MSEFKWHHFEGEIILRAVRWCCRYEVSYRDLEQMMGERGALVDHSTIYCWAQKYAPEIEKRLRWQWRRTAIFNLTRDIRVEARIIERAFCLASLRSPTR
jgi:transposase-like protein